MNGGGVVTTINTDTAAEFIPEIWSDGVLEAVESNLVFATLVNRDYEGEIKQYGDTVRIPNVSNLAAHDKVKGTAVTVQAPTEDKNLIVINKHKEVSFYIEDVVNIQSKKQLREVYTKKAGYAIAKALDSDIAGLYAGLSQQSGNGASAITDDLILNAIEYLDNAEAPESDRALVIRPSQKKAMLKIDKFVKWDYRAANGQLSPVVTGKFGEIYGAQVYVTTQIPLADAKAHNLCFHKDAFAIAVQMEPRVQAQYKQEYLATLVTVDILYGVAELRDTFGVDIWTTN